MVLTLQNGIDNEEVLAEILGEERILSGVAYITSAIEAPGVIKQLLSSANTKEFSKV
jgi:2-dehydropantoate 2-reductase